MIRHLKHTEIDKQHWDKCILSSKQNIVYALSWYLDIVSPGWEALALDDYSAVFPLTCRKKWSFNYLYQPYFTQQLGLFSKEKSEDLLISFLQNIPGKFKLIEIQLNHENDIYGLNRLKEFEIKNRITHHLDLSEDSDELFKGYSENQKRNIKKFDKKEGKIISSVSISEAIELFRKNRGSEINNLKEKDYIVLKSLYEEAGRRNIIECYGSLGTDNKLECAAIFLQSAYSYIFHFSATAASARNSGALSAVLDHFIKSHSGEKKLLDFEGSMDENLARFYKGFGSKEIVYLQILRNKLPPPFRWLK